MPQPERLRVWKGELLKTSGGLTIKDLMKNKRGKIVSKRKSQAAKDNANNLGDWLRKKGDNFFSKGITKDNVKKKGAAPGPKPKKLEVGKPVVVNPPKPKKKKLVNPPKAPKKKVVVNLIDSPPKKKKAVVNAPPKITRSDPIKPGDKVSSKRKSNISVANIVPTSGRPKRARKKRVIHNVASW